VLTALPALLLVATACAPAEDSDTGSDDSDTTSDSEATPAADECATDDLALKNDGVLTIGTDSPAFEPWFVDNDPTNGEGFESAVAYAVAEELGFSEDEVEWIKVRFNNSYKPGPKDFDFAITPI
jgi:polar amino acid transport system substrate-binding protein